MPLQFSESCFLLRLLDFAEQQKINEIQASLDGLCSRRTGDCRGLNSMTRLRACNTVRTCERQKDQNYQYSDKQKRHHKASVRSPPLIAGIASDLIWKNMRRVIDRS